MLLIIMISCGAAIIPSTARCRVVSDKSCHSDNHNCERLLAFLSLTPHIVELNLNVTEQLIFGLHSTQRLPCLRVLYVNECFFDDDILPEFCDMLETRCHVQPSPTDAAEDDGDNAATTKMELNALC